MEQAIKDIRKEVQEIKEKNEFEELFIANLDKSNRFKEKIIKSLLITNVLILITAFIAIGYLCHQMANGEYTTTTTTEATSQEGLYNFYDSEGNMVSSDLSLDEMQELIDLNRSNK